MLDDLLKDLSIRSRFCALSLIRSSETRRERQTGLLTTVQVLLSGGIHTQIASSDVRIIYRKQFGVFLSLGFGI